MAKFSNTVLSYYPKITKNILSNAILIPVWIRKIVMYDTDTTNINIFQEIILKLIHTGQYDRKLIASWLGVDVELVDMIIDTQLIPNGWIVDSRNPHLTDKGKQLIDKELNNNVLSCTRYLVEDAITGELWPRLLLNYSPLDIQMDTDDRFIFSRNKDSGDQIKPFMLNPTKHVRYANELKYSKVQDAIINHKKARASQKMMSHADFYEYYNGKISEDFELWDSDPEPVYLLSHLQDSLDFSHIKQIFDPTQTSQVDDWIKNLHLNFAKYDKPFANKIIKTAKQNINENETLDEMEKRISEDTMFSLMTEYPNVDAIENLAKHLAQAKRRLAYLKEKRRTEDADDLISQIQKALEACCKYMLKNWSSPSATLLPRNTNQMILRQLLLLRTQSNLPNLDLDTFCTVNCNQVSRAIAYSIGRFNSIELSLKPLIVANLLISLSHSNHPLITMANSESALKMLSDICELRNEGSHDSSTSLDVDKTIDLTNQALTWIKLFTTNFTK